MYYSIPILLLAGPHRRALASGAFTTASTGVAEFDDGPVCNVTGQTPRFGVLYFDVQMGDFQVLRRLQLPLLRLLLL